MLVYQAGFPAIETADVVSQELTVKVGDAENTESYSADATVSNEFTALDNEEVTLTLVYVDDAGNRSEPRVQSFIATDTIPPAQPGELAITLLREENPPAPEPPVEEPTE
jgi:hypothetical protein